MPVYRKTQPLSFASSTAISEKLTGCFTCPFLENTIEIGWVIETRLIASIQDVSGFQEALARILDPLAKQVLVERFTRLTLEQVGKATRRKLALRRHFFDSQWQIRVLIDVLDRSGNCPLAAIFSISANLALPATKPYQQLSDRCLHGAQPTDSFLPILTESATHQLHHYSFVKTGTGTQRRTYIILLNCRIPQFSPIPA
ncbi:hypothetical protein QEH56_21835 [Pelagicoccus enzymogenes]|nr:hypothetical protein [Pelagicoccus enzymogenes]MDQ8200823.1 hypothetical protein [Pelagicoccus enzymogenes]